MIDRIGGSLPPGALRATAAHPPLASSAQPAADNTAASKLTSGTAASPPVENTRVDQVKAAIGAGTYAIDPRRIATAMIARDLSAG